MFNLRRKHVLFLGVIVILIIGLWAGIIFLAPKNTATTKIAFSPTPTVAPTPAEYRKVAAAATESAKWKIFTDNTLKYSIRYPTDVIIDKRQTSDGRITVFIFDEDKTASLPGKVTALYLADTNKKGIDGFSAFTRGDCGSDCKVSYANTDWITINNMYGVKNPLPEDVHNYYLTDKEQSGSVLNAYVGGYIDVQDEEVQRKIDTFEEMIKTIRFKQAINDLNIPTPNPDS